MRAKPARASSDLRGATTTRLRGSREHPRAPSEPGARARRFIRSARSSPRRTRRLRGCARRLLFWTRRYLLRAQRFVGRARGFERRARSSPPPARSSPPPARSFAKVHEAFRKSTECFRFDSPRSKTTPRSLVRAARRSRDDSEKTKPLLPPLGGQLVQVRSARRSAASAHEDTLARHGQGLAITFANPDAAGRFGNQLLR